MEWIKTKEELPKDDRDILFTKGEVIMYGFFDNEIYMHNDMENKSYNHFIDTTSCNDNQECDMYEKEDIEYWLEPKMP